jgi:RNA polymerase sigma-70 factor (ECF subfamily)
MLANQIDTLYRRHHGDVYRYLLSRTGDRALAQDLTSETFLRAFRSRESYRDRGQPTAWLVTIARNLVLDHLGSARHRYETCTDWEVIADTWCAPDDPEAHTIQREARDRLHSALRLLPYRQGQCVFLRFVVGLSVDETATLLRVNPPAARAVQHRALRKLGELLM